MTFIILTIILSEKLELLIYEYKSLGFFNVIYDVIIFNYSEFLIL